MEVELPPDGELDEWGDEQISESRADLITYNLITYNLITYNALSANSEAGRKIIQYPLNSATYSDDLSGEDERADAGAKYLREQLTDEGAQLYFQYLVECALDKDQEPVKWVSPDEEFSDIFYGHIGLCPDWGKGPPSLACQELVAACMLARNNAFGVSVKLSLRGVHLTGEPIVDEDTLAAELAAFDTPEGAFYGNIFGGRVDPNVNIEVVESGGKYTTEYTLYGKPQPSRDVLAADYSGTLFTEAYACHSESWSRGEAYMRQRVCAGEDHDGCVAEPVGACYGPRRVMRLPWQRRTIDLTERRCNVKDNRVLDGDGDYDTCRAEPRGRYWYHPITVFLEDPCAATNDYEECVPPQPPVWRSIPRLPF